MCWTSFVFRQGSLTGEPMEKVPAGILHQPFTHPVQPETDDHDDVLLPESHFSHLLPGLTVPFL